VYPLKLLKAAKKAKFMPKPLIIGVDVRDLRVAKTGTKTYLEELCKEFKKMDSIDLRFHFLDTRLPVYTGERKIFKWIEHINFQIWKQLVLPLKASFKKCDIVFCTDICVPLIHLGYKTIPVFHDAFCFETPENYGKIWLWFYKKTAVPAAKRSPFVITPTAWSKKQINHFTKIVAEKLVVIPEGPKRINNDEGGNITKQLLTSFSLSKQSYILHVGSMFKRKNIPALIDAFSRLKNSGHPGLKLVLAGPRPANEFDNDFRLIEDAIEDKGLQDSVVLTGYLPDEELRHLYKNALMYVFPSINEGFGIPILEAFKYDLPVLVANNTCLPEVGGNAVLKFDPFNIDDMVLKMKNILDDAVLRKDMAGRGRERLKDFSWQKTATQLVEIFRKAG
jgi:glycosyltransferase involved in cell wall biosynthesis